MLALSRNERVIGRIIILIVSINTSGLASHRGAPEGSSEPVASFKFRQNPDINRLSQRFNPNVNEKNRWVETANVYGSIPIRLIRIRVKNSLVRIEDRSFIGVRLNWRCAYFIGREISWLFQEGFDQYEAEMAEIKIKDALNVKIEDVGSMGMD